MIISPNDFIIVAAIPIVMAPKLYIYSGSPPSRAVIITAKAIGLSIKIQEVDAEAGELYSSEFLKVWVHFFNVALSF